MHIHKHKKDAILTFISIIDLDILSLLHRLDSNLHNTIDQKYFSFVFVFFFWISAIELKADTNNKIAHSINNFKNKFHENAEATIFPPSTEPKTAATNN